MYLQRQKDKEARRTARCSAGGVALAWEQKLQQEGGAWSEVLLQAGDWEGRCSRVMVLGEGRCSRAMVLGDRRCSMAVRCSGAAVQQSRGR